MKQVNRTAILNHLRLEGPHPRAELARNLKVDGTTITNLVRELMKEKLIYVKEIGRSVTGKPQDILDINPEGSYAAGISLLQDSISSVILNLKGEAVYRERIAISYSISRDKLKELIKKLITNILMNNKSTSLKGLGIAYSGILPVESEYPVTVFNVGALEGLDVKSLLPEEFISKTRFIGGTRAIAETEMWLNKIPRDSNFCVIDLGIGIGCACINDGKIQTGEKGIAGEIGHTRIEPGGEKCVCGHFGCLETLASLRSVIKKVGSVLKKDSISFQDIVSLYQSGNDDVVEILNYAAKYIAIAAGNIINLENPLHLIFSGPMLELGEPFLDEIKQHIKDTALSEFLENLEIRRSSMIDYGYATGAAIVFIKDNFEIHE